jgi:hypothetical protein
MGVLVGVGGELMGNVVSGVDLDGEAHRRLIGKV